MRRASADDIPTLLELMAAFYAEAKFELNRGRAAAGLRALLSNNRYGAVWLTGSTANADGYVVLTICFSMEYAGTVGFIDDLYVRASRRRKGIGSRLLEAARAHCLAEDIRALFVEVGPENDAALSVYRQFGFTETKRQLLALPLSLPAHHEP